jgi:hypothetical protein
MKKVVYTEDSSKKHLEGDAVLKARVRKREGKEREEAFLRVRKKKGKKGKETFVRAPRNFS